MARPHGLAGFRNGAPAPAIKFQFLQRSPDHVFRQDCFLAVRLILWRTWLEVEADCKFVGLPAFKVSKLPKFLTRHHANTSTQLVPVCWAIRFLD